MPGAPGATCVVLAAIPPRRRDLSVFSLNERHLAQMRRDGNPRVGSDRTRRRTGLLRLKPLQR